MAALFIQVQFVTNRMQADIKPILQLVETLASVASMPRNQHHHVQTRPDADQHSSDALGHSNGGTVLAPQSLFCRLTQTESGDDFIVLAAPADDVAHEIDGKIVRGPAVHGVTGLFGHDDSEIEIRRLKSGAEHT
jgi:hypothetical protein